MTLVVPLMEQLDSEGTWTSVVEHSDIEWNWRSHVNRTRTSKRERVLYYAVPSPRKKGRGSRSDQPSAQISERSTTGIGLCVILPPKRHGR
jgi:hypothetical protein